MSTVVNFYARAMLGLAVFGDRTPDTIARILVGAHDEDILCAMHFVRTRSVPEALAMVRNEHNLADLERFKKGLRMGIAEIFMAAKALDHAAMLEELRTHSQPHEMGTVAEIAKRLGISKSEVRRRKQHGTLNSLLQQAASEDNVAPLSQGLNHAE